MTCVFPSRLDPTLAYPVPLRPSVFQHARFIDKMQPGVARVKQEKYEVYQHEPLGDGMWTLQLLHCSNVSTVESLFLTQVKRANSFEQFLLFFL